ncbi:MAG: glycyl-radical enzyme activating protein [Thermodesulfobacteriota bacterium]
MIEAPLIVDIKRDSREDGPGIRSVVFFKGCPLRCVFCHNPEGQEPGVEIAFTLASCIHCEGCFEACPEGAIDLSNDGRIIRDKCRRCGRCALACPSSALRQIGRRYTVETLTKLLLLDEPFYITSGGGVTLSGGECTLYPDYLEALLKELKKNKINVAIETSGHFNYDTFSRKILPYLDLIYYDIKLASPTLHKKHLGVTNELIVENLRRLLSESSIEVHPRVPLIPGITVTKRNLQAIVDLLSDAGARDVTLLPYNPLGIGMAEKIGREAPPLPKSFMKPTKEKRIRTLFKGMVEKKGNQNSAGAH